MSLNDDSYERQLGRQLEHVYLCTKGKSMCLGGDILARQLERFTGAIMSRCVERLSLLNVEGGRDFSY